MTSATVITTREFKRPDITIPWYHDEHHSSKSSIDFDEHLSIKYMATGKIIDRFVHGTSTTINVVIEWENEESMNEHYNDPVVIAHFANRDAYNSLHGITTTLSII
jgi:uncharacterized protein (DUF1330 family)